MFKQIRFLIDPYPSAEVLLETGGFTSCFYFLNQMIKNNKQTCVLTLCGWGWARVTVCRGGDTHPCVFFADLQLKVSNCHSWRKETGKQRKSMKKRIKIIKDFNDFGALDVFVKCEMESETMFIH